MKTKDIQDIVGEKHLSAWAVHTPTIYYRGGMPYGLIAVADGSNDWKYIASTTIDPELPFTKNMIRDIIRLYEHHSICLITDYIPAQEKIRSSLVRYGFTYKMVDNVLYSYHLK